MQLSRRRFLCWAIGGVGATGLPLATWLASRRVDRDVATEGDAALGPDGQAVFTRRSWALGTNVEITALHERREMARRGVDAAFAELERVESLMSIYRSDSQLARLNRDGELIDPHPCLVEVLQEALRMAERSQGAFDVTVQPLWALYAEAKKGGRLPDAESIAAARELVDYRRLEVQGDRVRLGRGMSITLNGIAQGYAADRAMAALRNHGIEHALVNAGEIGALGGKSKDQPWNVGIQHPRQEDAWLALVDLSGRCLATSGDYATTFSEDKRSHHIFDPRTGRSPVEFSSVTVAAATAMQADALSTAAFVLGPEKCMELVSETPGADVLCVLKDGRSFSTEGFPA